MSKIKLQDTGSGYNLQTINDNFRKIEEEFNEKVLYRDNPEGEPNELENDLDMNNKRIYNLPEPIHDHEPARKQDISMVEGYAAESAASAAKAKQSAIEAANSAASVQIKEQEREQIFEDSQAERENRFNDFIASSGYQFLGDYAPGIEITEYNQILRDGDGEFWRLSGQVELPYTTTGAGLPEDDSLTPLGDAVLRQELANPNQGAALVARGVVAVDSIAELLALPDDQRKEGLRYLVKEYYAGTGVGGGEFYWDSASTEADNGGTILGEGTGRFKRIYQGDVDVTWFGAVGDNATDCTDAFLSAFSINGATYVPAGNFHIKSPISLGSQQGKRLYGANKRRTRIRVAGTGGISTGASHQRIEGLSILCSNPIGSEYGLRILNTYFSAANIETDWTGGDAKFVNAVIVPSGASAYVSSWDNCLFSQCSGEAFLVEANSFNHSVFNAVTFRSSEYGFHLSGVSSHGITFVGCRAENNEGAGFRFAGRRGNQVSFVNPYLEHNGGAGIHLGYSRGSDTNDDYMEPVLISGLTSWENESTAVSVEKCRSCIIDTGTIGATRPDNYTNGGIRSSWGLFPFEGPHVVVRGVSRRGAATDYDLVTESKRILIEGGDSSLPDALLGVGPSQDVRRTTITGSGSNRLAITGAYASRDVELSGRHGSLGGSSFASSAVNLGDIQGSAVIASSRIDLSTSAGGISAVISSTDTELVESGWRQTILSSQGVKSASGDTVCGGYSTSEVASTANRKWEIDSRTGDIDISGAVSPGTAFSDFAELFPNGDGVEIPVGTIVTLDGDRVKTAGVGDRVSGVVSATAAIVAGDSPFCWQGRYLYDEFGRAIMEDIPDPDWQAEVYDEEGNSVPNPVPQGMISVHAENPEWDSTKPQIPRTKRPNEWTVVGLLGQVFVRVSDDVSVGDAVAPGALGVGVPSEEPTGLRCMRITTPYSEAKGYAVARCLVNVVA